MKDKAHDDPGHIDPTSSAKKDFWREENLKFATPGHRTDKAAQIINKIARGRKCTLLDVGCGPAALAHLLDRNIEYYGIDLAISDPAPNLIESDFLETPISFANKKFDIVVALGVFEYLGKFQETKFLEIARLLNSGGTFLVSYVNFGHRNREVYWPYSNVQPSSSFSKSLARYFAIRNVVPTSYNWTHSEPSKQPFRTINMYLKRKIPFIDTIFAVEYFFICSPRSGSTFDSLGKNTDSDKRLSLVHSFMNGVGGVFDLAGTIPSPVVPAPAFEDSLRDDVHNLYVKLGLDTEGSELNERPDNS